MNTSLFKNSVLLEWGVPEEWNTHVNSLKSINWGKALMSIIFLSVLFGGAFYLFDERGFSLYFIIIVSILFSVFLYFLEKFTRWASHPNATIYKSNIRIKYWEGTDEIEIKKIDSYRFKRLNIKDTQISVLEIKLKDGSYFEVGIPSSEFEENVRKVLSENFQIPYLGSFSF